MQKWLKHCEEASMWAVVWDQPMVFMGSVHSSNPGRYLTVGWMVAHKDDYMVLANTVAPDGDHGQLILVPYRCVVSAQKLQGVSSNKLLMQVSHGQDLGLFSQQESDGSRPRLKLHDFTRMEEEEEGDDDTQASAPGDP